MNTTLETRFLNDIKEHQLTILREDGIYRHLKAKRPESNCYAFEIVTWPGYLAYVGDMGSYTFCRIEDMFVFFRCPIREPLKINPGYWSEKVEAMDKNGKIEEFSPEKFRSTLLELVEDKPEELKESLKEYVLNGLEDNGEARSYQLASEFTFEGKPVFQDLWDHRFTTYTHHFLWCCYALVWAIRKYDEVKVTPV